MEEIDAFTKVLNSAAKKPAVLKITQPYAQAFIPKLSSSEFPKPLTDLYNAEALTMNYVEFLSKCEENFQSITVSHNIKKEYIATYI